MTIVIVARFFILLICGSVYGAPPSLYDILHVSPDATFFEIEKSYLTLSKLPTSSTEDKNLISLAFSILKNETTRECYDLYGEGSPPELDQRWHIHHSYNFDDIWQLPEFGSSNFDGFVMKSSRPWWIKLYWDGSPESSRWILFWNQIAKAIKGIARVGVLECTSHEELCLSLCQGLGGIHAGDVVLLSVAHQNVTRYDGTRTISSIIQQTLSIMDHSVRTVQDLAVMKRTSGEPPGPLLAMISTPSCLKCYVRETEFKKVSVLLESIVNVAVVRCQEVDVQREDMHGLIPCSEHNPCSACRESHRNSSITSVWWLPHGSWSTNGRVKYEGTPKSQDMNSFAVQQMNLNVEIIQDRNQFVDFVVRPTEDTFVVFASRTGSYHYHNLLEIELKKCAYLGLRKKEKGWKTFLIDCEEKKSHETCIRYGFRGYPRLYLFSGYSRRDVNRKEYLGDWFAQEIAEWIAVQ